jgi:poly(beta-D-mannuronate) lyase
MTYFKTLRLLLLGFCLGSSLYAREVVVKNAAELKGAIAGGGSGVTVKIAKGEYADIKFNIKTGGSKDAPFIIMAEKPGEVIFSGSSQVEINAKHVVLDGLFFYNGAIIPNPEDNENAVLKFNSDFGTIRNCAIVDYNPPEFKSEYYWVFCNGSSNTVERCYFKGKNNMQPLIGNGVEGCRKNTVRGCYFKNIPHAIGNGREGIRVWGSGKFDEKPTDGAYFTVEGNLFDHADGEGTEIVSLKSNFNQVLNNTVIATRGCFNIRRGSNNTMKGNIILGEGAEGAQGLRMSGANHIVQGNYVSGTEYGIRISCGEYVGHALTNSFTPKEKSGAKSAKNATGEVTSYPQVKKLNLSNNVIVGCKTSALEVGSDYKKHWPEEQLILLPEDSDITNNRFIDLDGKGVTIEGSEMDPKIPSVGKKPVPNRYKENIVMGGKIKYPPAVSGCKEVAMPSGWSEKKERANFKPLTANDVGPEWVIALRDAKQFPMEDDRSCYRESSGEEKKKKNKK